MVVLVELLDGAVFQVIGPFATVAEAQAWADAHPNGRGPFIVTALTPAAMAGTV